MQAIAYTELELKLSRVGNTGFYTQYMGLLKLAASCLTEINNILLRFFMISG